MNLDEYQIKAKTFAVYDSPFYPVWSLVAEAQELERAVGLYKSNVYSLSQVNSEAGDFFWDMANLLADQQLTLSQAFETKGVGVTGSIENCFYLVNTSIVFADILAKPMLRGDNWPTGSTIMHLSSHVMRAFAEALKSLNLTLDEVMDYNIQKLTDRKARGVIKGSGGNR